MRTTIWILLFVFTAIEPARLGAQLRLDSNTTFQAVNGRVLWETHNGRRAVHLVPLAGHEHDTDQEMSATLVGSDFHDGVIEVDVSGTPRAGMPSSARGFIGGAPQPVLVVTDLKRGDTSGRIALWANTQTDAYFGAVSR